MSFSCTIWRFLKISVSQPNSTYTTESPSPLVDRTRVTPVAPFTACSTRRVTSRSTSSGTSPCASVMTVTVGRFRSGNMSTGSDNAVQIP